MVLDQEFEHFHRIAAVDIKGSVKEFNDLGPIIDQIQQVRLYPLNIVVPHTDLDAGQAKLTAERTAAACLEINDALAEIRKILGKTMRRRQRVQIGLRPSRIDDHLVAFAICGSEHIMELAIPGQLLQQMVECLFSISHDDEIHALDALHPVLRIIGYFRPAEDDGRLRQHFFQNINNANRLFNVPNIAGEPDHIGPALKQVGHDVHRRVFNRILGELDIKLISAVSL
ncbi:hypothetical protein D3C77_412900 [compost metagenome]